MTFSVSPLRASGLAALLCMLAGPTLAQRSGQLPPAYEGAGIEEQLGAQLPLDAVLTGEQGEVITVGALLKQDRPILLNFVYYECPMLCSLLLDGLTRTLQQMEWTPGKQFDVVTISFVSGEGPDLAMAQKRKYADRLRGEDAAAGWRFLTGDEDQIRRLTQTAGFQFKWVEEEQQYVHPATIMFVSPEGVLTRYLHGLEFQPRDVRTALVEASDGKVGTALDQVILFCFKYDPARGAYVPYVFNIMKLGGLLTVLVLGAFLFIFWRRENRRLDEPQVVGAAADQPL